MVTDVCWWCNTPHRLGEQVSGRLDRGITVSCDALGLKKNEDFLMRLNRERCGCKNGGQNPCWIARFWCHTQNPQKSHDSAPSQVSGALNWKSATRLGRTIVGKIQLSQECPPASLWCYDFVWLCLRSGTNVILKQDRIRVFLVACGRRYWDVQLNQCVNRH